MYVISSGEHDIEGWTKIVLYEYRFAPRQVATNTIRVRDILANTAIYSDS